MKKVQDKILTGERAAYASVDTEFVGCTFTDGESPLKECRNLSVKNSCFGWKYPLWYCQNVQVSNCEWQFMGRSGVWYTQNIQIRDSVIGAPKQFRVSSGITVENCSIPQAEETLWSCRDVTMKNVTVCGDYFGLNCQNVNLENVKIDGNYCFDGAKNVVAKNCVFNSKDSFWNCENVQLTDCEIDGEYLAWNSKNVKFVRCKLTSHQALCYVDGLTLVDCQMYETDLAFERCSNVNAEVTSHIVSIKNPLNGKIRCKSVGEIVLDDDIVDKSAITIEVEN